MRSKSTKSTVKKSAQKKSVSPTNKALIEAVSGLRAVLSEMALPSNCDGALARVDMALADLTKD